MNGDTLHIDVSIVIVNYRSWNHLHNCLASIQSIKSKEVQLEVIIIDNCSNDGKLSGFKNKFPKFTFIENTGNNGFANGCNLGAKNTSGDYLLFLNPDTIISKEPVLKMFTFLEEHKDCGIVSCNQKNVHGSYEKNIRFFPDIHTLFGLFRAIHRKRIYKRIAKKDVILYPDWVSGAVVFISRNWFERIKGWNEDFWMYYEDIDLSKKVADLGGKIALLTDTEIIHNHGGSSRINIKTATITKTEVLISKHVYIRNHFRGGKHFILQILLILNNLIGKLILAIFGIIFFIIPKLRVVLNLYIHIIKYYFASLIHRTWLSSRSMNHPNKK